MSGTAQPAPSSDRKGAVVISVVSQATFIVAFLAAGYLYWVTRDPVVLAILSTMAGVAATNSSSVTQYWVGSSVGSDKKTDLLAQAQPIGTKPP